MTDEIKSSKPASGKKELLGPGEPEMRARAANLAAGTVPLLPSTLQERASMIATVPARRLADGKRRPDGLVSVGVDGEHAVDATTFPTQGWPPPASGATGVGR